MREGGENIPSLIFYQISNMAELGLKYSETYNPYEIGIEDISDYGNYPIHTPLFTVTPPGYPKREVAFSTGSVNTYNYDDLIGICGENCPELPDGNYVFEYSIKPNDKKKIKKNYYRVTTALSKYYRLFVTTVNGCSCSDKQALRNLMEIRMLIEGVVSSANACDLCLAEKLYITAIKKIDSYGKNCGC